MRHVLLVCNSLPFHSAGAVSAAVVRLNPDPLGTVLDSDLASGSAILHPPDASLWSFGFRSDAHNARSFHVSDRRMIGWFDSANKSNLIYFASPPQEDHIWFAGLGTPVLYERISEHGLDPQLGESVAAAFGPCHSHFFRQVDAPAGDNPQFTLTVQTPTQDALPLDCWMNPIILRLALEGNEILTGRPDGILRKLVDPGALLFVEPILDHTWDYRVLFLRDLAVRIADRGGLSAIENLLLGPSNISTNSPPSDRWGKPFLVLDSIGGTFCLTVRADEIVCYGWVLPPKHRKTNARWIAQHWHSRWGGAWLDIAPVSDIVDADPLLFSGRTARWTNGVRIDKDELAKVVNSADRLLNRHLVKRLKEVGALNDGDPLDWVARLLGARLGSGRTDYDDGDVVATCHRGFYEVDRESSEITDSDPPAPGQESYVLSLDVIEFVDEFMRRHVLPKSQILIEFPQNPVFKESAGSDVKDQTANEYNRALGDVIIDGAHLMPVCFDMVTSVQLGGWEFTRRLTSALKGKLMGHGTNSGKAEHQTVFLPYRFGWWVAWLDALFSSSRDCTYAFEIIPSGFILGTSRLGREPLGRTEQVYRQTRHLKL